MAQWARQKRRKHSLQNIIMRKIHLKRRIILVMKDKDIKNIQILWDYMKLNQQLEKLF